ncbi:PEP-CTERM sorting domain-containing protein [Posidoniimonas corsicana]|nr:PEP-CTERM sorting domain-containing protein [Posidoniimonas corsicana]
MPLRSLMAVLLLTQSAAALTFTAEFDAQFVLQDHAPGAAQPTYAQTVPVGIEVVTDLQTVSYRVSWDLEDVRFTPDGAAAPLYVSSAGEITPVADLGVLDDNAIWIYLESPDVLYAGGWEVRTDAADGALVSQAAAGAVTQETGSFTNLIFDNSGPAEGLSLEGFAPPLAQPLGDPVGGYSLAIDISSPYFLLTQTLSGDMNSDGQVDSADYTVWRDADGPLKDRLTSYDDWRSNYGGQVPSAAAASSAPEPAAAGLLAVGLLASLRRRRRIG